MTLQIVERHLRYRYFEHVEMGMPMLARHQAYLSQMKDDILRLATEELECLGLAVASDRFWSRLLRARFD